MSYDDENENIPYTEISDRWVKARTAKPCDGLCTTGIQPGDVYRKLVALVDGEFTVTKTCGYCDSGYPRSGTPEHDQFVAEYDAQVREDEAQYNADQQWFRQVLAAKPGEYPADVVDYARAGIEGKVRP